jgi:hypothetical protein
MLKKWGSVWAVAGLMLLLGGVPATAVAASPVVTINSGPSGVVNTRTVTFTFSANETQGTQFDCGLDTPTLKACASPDTLGPLAAGTHTFYVRAFNAKSTPYYSSVVSSSFSIEHESPPTGSLPGVGGPVPPGSGVPFPSGPNTPGSTPVPTVSGLTQSYLSWRAGTELAQISRARRRGPPVGTTFRFALNEAAKVRLAFTRAASGRRVNGHCVAQTTKNRGKRACERTIKVGAVSLGGHAGTNRVHFQGRISAHTTLKPGRYKMVLSASAGGLLSAPRSLTFTILS